MEALRFVVCGRPECRQVFFLCSACDRGRRYCGSACSRRARTASVREAGRRYQRTRDGRHAHAARQAAWRQRQKVTHQAPPPGAPEATVAPEPTGPAMEADTQVGSARPLPHAPPSLPTCASCGRTSPFTRHTTLARTHLGPRWRRARPP
ncbi:hypothetical protein [Archangium sp.]|uniref:hypothetical protein n=1 Tax=Archangium sp. TaxID=1872627 RepID=UPI002869FBA9|nr:hypothetical protein [Archangium sp.]